jgi:AraC-like DNA-binding protein
VRVFDTADFAPRDRRDAYMNAFAGSEVPEQVTLPSGVQLAASLDLWELGPGAHVLRTQGTVHRLTRTSRQLRVAAPERVALAYSRRSAVVAVGGSVQRLRPGDLHVNDQTLPSDYAGYGEGGAEAFIVDWEVLGLPIDLGRRAVSSVASSPLYELFRHHIGRVCSTLDAMPHDEPARSLLGSATMDLARALLSTLADDERFARDVMHNTEPARIRAYIEQHLKDRDLTPARIARASHVSLRQLHKVWGSDGPSFSDYIIATLLARAREDLRRPALRSRSIFEIASSWGFADPAHFSRRFRAAYGMPPRQWRRHSLTA